MSAIPTAHSTGAARGIAVSAGAGMRAENRKEKTMKKTLFQWIPVGTDFEAVNGTIFTKRRENFRNDLVTFCHECQKRVGANAIIKGRKIDDTGSDKFVHFCPIDYVKE